MKTTQEIIDSCREAFWSTLAREVPRAQSGDITPHTAEQFDATISSTVTEWIRMNAPCGCKAGMYISSVETTAGQFVREVKRCADCKLFESDDDAAGALDALLDVLATVYRENPGDSVASSYDRIVEACQGADLLPNHVKITMGGR